MSSETALVSCVIPTHNRADLLPRAIKSIQNQTYKNLEIIIVSDGSTDNTAKVMKALCETDARIKFIDYPSAQGGNFARNIGIEKARGELIAFLDDDDEWLPEKIEKQIQLINDEVGLVYTGVKIIYVNEKIEYTFISKKKGDLSKEILLDNCIGTTSAVMIKKELLEKAGMFDNKLKALQDFDLWIRVCQLCKVDVVEEELIYYYNYTGKVQVSATTQKYVDSFDYINNKYKKLFNHLNLEKAKEKKRNEYMLLANKAMRNGDKKLTRKYIGMALKNGFSKNAIAYWGLSFTNFRIVLKIRKLL